MRNCWRRDFRVADHCFAVENVDCSKVVLARGFEYFEIDAVANPLFTLRTGASIERWSTKVVHTFAFDRVECQLCVGDNGYEFTMSAATTPDIILQMPFGSEVFYSNAKPTKENSSLVRFMLWVAFGVAVAPHATVAVHSSVVVYRQECVLFLGESGTGKSTHTSLWLRHILGSRLLNDDSPIVCLVNGVATCFGSPWSGKTPCYINESYPIRAFVRLQQAQQNSIVRLPKVMAFGATYPSCPPSFAYNERLTDFTCSTLSGILLQVPVYKMGCLPTAEAVELSRDTVFGERK